MKKYLSQDTLILCLAFIMAIFMVSSPFVVRPSLEDTGPSWLGLDVSWQMTLNYARMNHWVWGQDIIYTYGPLGFLATRIGLGVSKWVFLLFDIFVVVNFFYIYRDFLKNALDKWLAFFMILAISITIDSMHGSDLSWVITVFSFYWMYKIHDNPRVGYFAFLCINIIICFYLKLNTGLVGVMLLTGQLINMLIFRKIKWFYPVLVLLSLSAGIVVTGYLLHVSLPDYIKGALQIIKGYNDVMQLDTQDFLRLELDVAILYYSFIGFCIIYFIGILREKKFSHIFFVGIAVLYIFLLRKQSVVRNDAYHYCEFFGYSSLVLLSGFFLKPFDKLQRPISLCMLLLITLSMLYEVQNSGGTIDRMAMRRFTGLQEYFNAVSNYDKKPFLNNKRKRYIPARVLDQIQNKTVDIFPWDSEYLLENKLNYTPRPVFQSFSSYTHYLQEKNYAFYEKHAPEYIIYDYESIDDRYPFNDDILTNFFICKNYTFADSFVSNGRWRTLLKKKDVVAPIQIDTPGRNKSFKIGQEMPVDWTMMMSITIGFTDEGRIESAYYRTPKVTIMLQRESGSWKTYKVSKEMMKTGVFVDRWINSNADYAKYMKDKFLLDRIVKVKIIADKRYYAEGIKVNYCNVK